MVNKKSKKKKSVGRPSQFKNGKVRTVRINAQDEQEILGEYGVFQKWFNKQVQRFKRSNGQKKGKRGTTRDVEVA